MVEPVSDQPANDLELDQDLPVPQPMDIRSTLEKIHQSTTELFQEEIQKAGGAKPWLCRLPSVSGALASLSTEAEMDAVVRSETQAFWVGIETRMRECAACPPEGAACFGSSHCFSPGVLVKLRVKDGAASSSLKTCERYQDFTMARRLESAGVDATLSGLKLSTLGVSTEEFDLQTASFLRAGIGHAAPRGMQLLIEGPRAREYGVVLFRSTIKNYRNAIARSVHVPSLIRAGRSAMTAKESSPIDELISCDVLVLDGVDTPSLKNKYFMQEILWMYGRRRDQGLATIITSYVPAKEAFKGATVVRV